MGFRKDKLNLPRTTLPPPQSPPSRHLLYMLGWFFCVTSLVILHVTFFAPSAYSTIFSHPSEPPTFHLISAKIHVTTLDAGEFSSDWKLDFNISNPPSKPYISFTPTSAAIVSPIRHVILADTHDVTPTQKDDLIEAQARLFSPPNQTLDGAVLKRILDDRAHGFMKFDVEIKVNVVFSIKLSIPIPISDKDGEYKVTCKGLEFYFADEEAKEGVAKIAPGMCELKYEVEPMVVTLLYFRPGAT